MKFTLFAKKANKFDTTNKDLIICPICGFRYSYSQDYKDCNLEIVECRKCGYLFYLEVFTFHTFSTRPYIGPLAHGNDLAFLKIYLENINYILGTANNNQLLLLRSSMLTEMNKILTIVETIKQDDLDEKISGETQ